MAMPAPLAPTYTNALPLLARAWSKIAMELELERSNTTDGVIVDLDKKVALENDEMPLLVFNQWTTS